MTFIPSTSSNYDSNNSTTTTGTQFVGTSTDVSQYSSINITVNTPLAGTLVVSFSSDNSTWVNTSNNVTATSSSNIFMLNIPVIDKYFKLTLTFQSSTTFTLLTVLKNTTTAISAYNNSNKTNIPLTTTVTGDLNVAVNSPLSSFGELSVSEQTPVSQLAFDYNLINTQTTTSASSGGSITASNGLLEIASGATIGNYAYLQSKKTLVYRPGQGSLARYTGVFPNNSSGSIQFCGIGNVSAGAITDGLGFGYSGTSFGILYYKNGSLTFINQTAWNVDNLSGNGGNSNPSGNLLDPSKGNVYQIKFQYLGFGDLRFFVENSNTALFSLVHIIKYPNLNTIPSVTNPTMPLLFYSQSNGTNVSVSTASASLFIEGKIRFNNSMFTYDNYATLANGAPLTNIFALKCVDVLNTKPNTGLITLRTISCSVSSTNSCNTILQIIFSPTGSTSRWTTSPTFTSVATQSIASVSGPLYGTTPVIGTLATTGTGLASYATGLAASNGSTLVYSLTLTNTSSITIDVTDLDIVLAANEIISFAAKGSNAFTVSVSVTWSEDW